MAAAAANIDGITNYSADRQRDRCREDYERTERKFTFRIRNSIRCIFSQRAGLIEMALFDWRLPEMGEQKIR